MQDGPMWLDESRRLRPQMHGALRSFATTHTVVPKADVAIASIEVEFHIGGPSANSAFSSAVQLERWFRSRLAGLDEALIGTADRSSRGAHVRPHYVLAGAAASGTWRFRIRLSEQGRRWLEESVLAVMVTYDEHLRPVLGKGIEELDPRQGPFRAVSNWGKVAALAYLVALASGVELPQVSIVDSSGTVLHVEESDPPETPALPLPPLPGELDVFDVSCEIRIHSEEEQERRGVSGLG